MPKYLLNLFALLDDDTIKRITVTGDLQEEVSNLFIQFKNDFYNDQEIIDFDGRYKVEDGEIFKVDNFPIESTIITALTNPLSVNLLRLNEDEEKIKSLFCGVWSGENPFIVFQAFDSRKLLTRKFTLLNSGETYSKLENPGIIIDDGIDALLIKDKLLFHSYFICRRIFDLSNYFREATNEDLQYFSDSEVLSFEDKSHFLEIADTWVRKKVALLQKNCILDSLELTGIEEKARSYGVSVKVIEQKGKKTIYLPKNKKEIKAILKFLDEDYFTGVLTGRKCLTNSKRYIA